MKHRIILVSFILFMGLANSLFGQKEIVTSSKIDKVIVYLTNAQIERSASVNLPAGTSEIVVSGLSQYLDPNSLRVSGKGSFVILSQQVQIKYPEPKNTAEDAIPAPILKKINALSDSIESIAYDIMENQSRKEVFQAEKSLLQSNRVISGSDTLPELKEGLNFYRTKMIEINAELLKITKREKLLYKQKNEMEARLVALRNYSASYETEVVPELAKSEIRFQVMTDKAVPNAIIEFTYLTSGVTWEPFYELKVEEVSKPVQLILKANVAQQTGENWEKAKLVFSTGKPSVYKVLPNLLAWYLTYYMPPTAYSQNMYSNVRTAQTTEKKESAPRTIDASSVSDNEVMKDAQYSYEWTQTTQNLLFAEYEVSLPYTIPSDGKKQTIALMSANLTANYKFLAIPKMDKDVFSTAYLQGWEKLSLVQGRANIIYQNSIISQTYINPSTAIDTLVVSLGVDKRVVVDRKKISDKSKDKIVGNTRERSIYIEITVKNQNQTEVSLVLKDQIPITEVPEIKVIPDEMKEAIYDENTGELLWNLTLKPNETKKVSFRYTIRFDKTKSLLSE